MNGVSRFLSRREKKAKGSAATTTTTSIENGTGTGATAFEKRQNYDSNDLFQVFHDHSKEKKKSDKEEQKKIKALLQRLQEISITDLTEHNVEYALRSPSVVGNSDKAFDLLLLYRDAIHGLTRPVDPGVQMLGAVNRENVTCYLDSLLFAMFGRMNSFEVILDAADALDPPRKELAMMLRLWVNMLRTGKLITPDISQTQRMQESLKECGWSEGALLRQQDVSEAFTNITDMLNLPLLTLKMDVYHTGKEDRDDHRIVQERLLEVAIPEEPKDGIVVRLEDCLESYFNNKIEVKRHMQRRNTVQSSRSSDNDKTRALHVETVELRREVRSSSPNNSIFSQRAIDTPESFERRTHDDISVGSVRPRTSTIRREVLMPAWQFFSLIPWNSVPEQPSNDVQVAAHLQTTRPVLGICLKRYSMNSEGVGTRLDYKIDVPLEIGLPHFISDDTIESSGFAPNFTNFKLSLQSVICHRGKSLDAGHYISLVRNQMPDGTPITAGERNPGDPMRPPDATWMRFDDLAKPESNRVSPVNIQEALEKECPYLLFYQVQPIDEDDDDGQDNPPTYDEVMVHPGNDDLTTTPTKSSSYSTSTTDASSLPTQRSSFSSKLDAAFRPSPKTLPSMLDVGGPANGAEQAGSTPHENGKVVPTISTEIPAAALSILTMEPSDLSAIPGTNGQPESMNISDLRAHFERSSVEIPRGRASHDNDRRSSIIFTDNDNSVRGGASAPITPGDDTETKSSYLGASRQNSVNKSWRRPKSRPTSQNGENRLSIGMSRIKYAMSKDKLGSTLPTQAPAHVTSPLHAVVTGEAFESNGSPDKDKSTPVSRSKSVKHMSKKGRRGSSAGRTVDALTLSSVGIKKKGPDRQCSLM